MTTTASDMRFTNVMIGNGTEVHDGVAITKPWGEVFLPQCGTPARGGVIEVDADLSEVTCEKCIARNAKKASGTETS